MKHFLSALALGCLLLSCNRDLENNENNETPAPPKEERLVLASLFEYVSNVRFQYKNGNEINMFFGWERMIIRNKKENIFLYFKNYSYLCKPFMGKICLIINDKL